MALTRDTREGPRARRSGSARDAERAAEQREKQAGDPGQATGALVASPMHRNREIKRQEKIKWWKEKGFEL